MKKCIWKLEEIIDAVSINYLDRSFFYGWAAFNVLWLMLYLVVDDLVVIVVDRVRFGHEVTCTMGCQCCPQHAVVVCHLLLNDLRIRSTWEQNVASRERVMWL